MMHQLRRNAVTITLVVAAAIMTGVAVERAVDDRPIRSVPPRPVDNWDAMLQEAGWMGSDTPLIRVVEFSDYQCGFCAQAEPRLESLLSEFRDDLALLVIHFPIEELHPLAVAAASAAECARTQGGFEIYHRVLFRHQADLATHTWGEWATIAGLSDPQALNDCVTRGEMIDKVRRHMSLGEAAHIVATPSFVIDGVRYVGGSGLDSLESILARTTAGR